MNELEKIVQKPIVINKIHGSVFRYYDILNLVLKMIERGDSTETIKDVTNYLINYPSEQIQSKTV